MHQRSGFLVSLDVDRAGHRPHDRIEAVLKSKIVHRRAFGHQPALALPVQMMGRAGGGAQT